MQALSPSLDSRSRSPADYGPTRSLDASGPNGRGTGEAFHDSGRLPGTGENPRGSLRLCPRLRLGPRLCLGPRLDLGPRPRPRPRPRRGVA
jgi:hypothetical protein